MSKELIGNLISIRREDSDETPFAPAHPLSNVELSPESWVASFLEAEQIGYDYKTSSLRQEGQLLDCKLVLSKMRLATYRYDVPHFRQFLKDGLSLWMRLQSKGHIALLRNQLKFCLSDIDHVAQWVTAATGKADPCDVAVMRHFVWQVKRKLFGFPVDHHMMPVAFGKSGGGKSVAIHKLLEPLETVTLLQNLTVFNDSFSRRMFATNYVMFFDELGKSKQVDINCLKNTITAPTVEWRGIQSESIHSAPQNCTFIAASNDPLSERIKDTTSARRFWQLNCADLLHWEKINTIDYLSLWKSVDEGSHCPILSNLADIQNLQRNELQSPDPIEEWISLFCQKPQSSETSFTTSEIYLKFREWRRRLGCPEKMSLQKFSREFPERLRKVHPEIRSVHSHNGTTWALTILNSR